MTSLSSASSSANGILVIAVVYLSECLSDRRVQYHGYNYDRDNDLYRNYYRDDNADKEHDNDRGDDDDDYDDDIRPVFLPTERNVTTNPGKEALLKCHIRSLVGRTVTWRRLGSIYPLTIGTFNFASDSRVSIDQREHVDDDYSQWNLRLRNVTPFDEGTYQCQVNTKDDQKNVYNVYLQVTIIQVTGTESVEKGGLIQLLCNATGRPYPPHNVEWYKDDRMIESDVNDGVVITKKIETKLLVSVLVIKRSKPSDAGEYHCRSSDQDVGKISVNVQNAPVEKRGTSAAKIMSGNTSSKHIHFRLIWFGWLLAQLMTLRWQR